ncbi:hypothetical protein [Ekhidna sp.]|uniref:hypothetical protein n=1 Tax=Ekhidna sp. TaxID=2608089 RepID=UPI003B5B3037
MKRLITLMLVIIQAGCDEKPSDSPIFKYYPPESVFEDGFVSKYYSHYYPDNTDRRPITEVKYTKHVRLDENHFMTEEYNAGFQLMNNRFYEISGDSLILDRGMGISYRDYTDTTELNLLSKVVSVWEHEMKTPYQIQYEFDDQAYIYTEQQQSAYDSIILDKPAKVFLSEWNYREAGKDSTFNKGKTRSYYVQDMGFFGSDGEGEDYSLQMELIEQMSVEEFEKRAAHGEHRVAWIDPDQTIGDDTEFTLCGHEIRIADYYNSTPDGRYLHDKRAMMDTIFTNLDKSKLEDQNGSLVFRFVVNCEGKAGRFIAKGYDVNYQPMEFRKETVEHLYSILKKLEDWRPVVIGDEGRDAYYYINFKIENGEIIDILP